MKTKLLSALLAVLLFLMPNLTFGQSPPLGTASDFVLFSSTGAFDNTGASVVTGDIGSDAVPITGFPPGTVIGQTFNADPTTAQAFTDIGVLYGFLAAYPDGPVHGATIVTETLLPNCHKFGGASTLDGILTLDAQGDPDALFIFKVDGAFSTSAGAQVVLINGASSCNVWWQVNGQFELGVNADFIGSVVASGAISLLEGASLTGRALTTTGAVTLQNNVVTLETGPTASVITGPTTLCAGESITLSGNDDGGTWSTGATTTSIIVTTAGDYFVTNTSPCGSVESNHIIVTVNPLAIAATITAGGPLALCSGENVVLSGNVGGTWSTGATTATITVTAAGDYYVTNTTICGDVTSNHIIVTAGEMPVASTIAADGATTFCEGESVVLSGNVGGTWSTGETTATITVTTSGDYFVTNTNGCGTVTSNHIPVTVNPATGVTLFTAGATAVCVDATNENYTATAVNSTSIVYSVSPVGAGVINASTGVMNWEAAFNGAATITATSTGLCGVTTAERVVTVYLPVEATQFTTGAITVCQNAADETYTATAVNSTSVVYSVSPVGAGVIDAGTGVMNWAEAFSGTATITATSSGPCGSTTADRVVTVNPLPTASTITPGSAAVLCEGVELVLSGNVGGTWSTGATTATITVTTAGDYFVTNTNGCGDVTSNHIIVTAGVAPTASVITAAESTTICEGEAVVLSGNVGGTWSNGATTATISVTSAGDYFVTNTNACGSVTSNVITVTVNQLPVASTISADGPIMLCPDGSVVLSGNIGGTWSTGATTATITVTAAGDYFVTNTNSCGSVTSNHILVTTVTVPVASIISTTGETTICEGESVVLSGNVGGTWSTGETTATITVTTSGDYYVSNAYSCGTVSSNVISVTVEPLPTASVITAGGPIALCPGDNVVLSGNVGGTWSTGATTATITVTEAGDYYVTNTNDCGSVTSNHILVSVSALPTATVITAGGATTICEDESVTLSGNDAGGTWSNGATTASITVSTAGDYFVTTVYTCGIVTSNIISVTVNPLPTASVITAGGPVAICAGDNVVLSGNVGGTWSTGATTATINVSAAGDYYVTNTNDCGSVTSNHIIVTDAVEPTASIITAGGAATTFCEGESVVLSGNVGGVWSNGATTPTITVTESGDYYVTNEASCGTATSNHILVTVNPLPTAAVISADGEPTLCAGESVILSGNVDGTWNTGATTATITVTATGDYFVTNVNNCGSVTSNHIMVTPGVVPTASTIAAVGATTICEGEAVVLLGNVGGTWSNGATTPTITVTSAGDYSVTNTNVCGSATSNVITVTVTPLPSASIISAESATALCADGSVVLSGNIGGTWSNGATTASITVSEAGDYFVTNTSTCGTVTSNHIVVTTGVVPEASIILAGGDITFCEGESVVLSGNVGGTWSTGETSATITVTTTGDYFVTNSYSCGNAISNHIVVTVNPLPTASIITAGGPVKLCTGDNVVLSGNVGGTWSTGATTATITVTVAGDYYVTNTNDCGSVTSNHIIVSVGAPPTATVITAGGATTICEDESVTLSGNDAGGTWNTGATTASITVSTAGDYFVTTVYSCGTVTSNTISVTANPLPTASVITAGGPVAICAGDNVVLSGNVGGTWSTGATTATITVSAAGEYFVINTNGCGSVTSNHIMVTDAVAPTASIISAGGAATTICEGESVVLSGNSGGVWSNGATTATITVTESGDYYVTNEASCGTATSNHILVTVNPLPIASVISADGPTTICADESLILSGNVDGTWNSGSSAASISIISTGDYYVTNTNNCGSATSNHIFVKVNPLVVASVITAGGETILCEGETVALSGNVGGIWSNSATTPTINVSTTGDYFVTNTNSCGEAVSNHISVTVNPLPVVSTISADGVTTFCEGEDVILSGNVGGTWSNSETTPTITVVASGDYFVTNANSCGSLTSNHIVVTVVAVPSSAVNQTVCAGSSVSFSVGQVAGLTYQWRRGSVILVNEGNISGVSTSTLTINPVKNTDAAANYNVVITGPCAPYEASANLSLVVNSAPVILGQPYDQNGAIGCDESFLVVATGSSLHYQWRRGTQNIVNGGNISGATSARLTLSPVNLDDVASDYNVVVTGACGPSSTSDDVSLIICEPTAIPKAVVENINNEVAIYPNPFSTSINVVINKASELNSIELRMFNALGEEILISTITKPLTVVETGNLVRGVYLYQIISKSKIIQTGKLVSIE